MRKLDRAISSILPTPPLRTIFVAASANPVICDKVTWGGIERAFASGRLLVADVDPLDPFRPADRVHERVQAVTDNTEDAGHSGLAEDLDQLITDGAHAIYPVEDASPG